MYWTRLLWLTLLLSMTHMANGGIWHGQRQSSQNFEQDQWEARVYAEHSQRTRNVEVVAGLKARPFSGGPTYPKMRGAFESSKASVPLESAVAKVHVSRQSQLVKRHNQDSSVMIPNNDPIVLNALQQQQQSAAVLAEDLGREEGRVRKAEGDSARSKRLKPTVKDDAAMEKEREQLTNMQAKVPPAPAAAQGLTEAGGHCRRIPRPLSDFENTCLVRSVQTKVQDDELAVPPPPPALPLRGKHDRRSDVRPPPVPMLAGVVVEVECIDYVWVFKNNKMMRNTHMATIAATPDGMLVVAFQAARYNEGDSDQQIMFCVSHDGGRQWSPPRPLMPSEMKREHSNGAQWGPALSHHDGTDHLSLFYSQSVSCRSSEREEAWAPGGDVFLSTSTDGQHWSKPRLLAEQGEGLPKVTANPSIVNVHPKREEPLEVVPIWEELPRKSDCSFAANATDIAELLVGSRYGTASCAEDDSCTCREKHGDISCARRWTVGGQLQHPNTWLIESSIVTFPDGHMLQLFRTTLGKVLRSSSANGGVHWTVPEPTTLLNPNSKLHTLILSNGLLAVCYNAHSHKEIKDGVRTLLTVAVSANRGKTWETLAELETAQRPEGTDFRPMFHYPTMYQRGCNLYVVYTVALNVAGTTLVASEPMNSFTTGIRMAKLDLRLYDRMPPVERERESHKDSKKDSKRKDSGGRR